MRQISISAAAPSQTRWGSLQRSPDLLPGFKEPTSKGRKDGREGKGEGRVREDKGGRGGKEHFRAFPQFRICQYTTECPNRFSFLFVTICTSSVRSVARKMSGGRGEEKRPNPINPNS